MTPFATSEKYLSQIPALKLLISLGYEYLSPARALVMRGAKTSNVLLEEVLRGQLEKINRIHYKGTEYLFSEANIQEAVRKLKNVKHDGLMRNNESIYDLITLGTALEQTVENDMKSFNLNYIDWKNPTNNRFHVVPEYTVERARSTETVRPDIVLFVNGIPLGVIECKSPNVDVMEAVSQSIRNQGDEYIPKLFTYAQLVMGVNKNSAKYATVRTPANLWSVWNEMEDKAEQVARTVNTPLNPDQKSALFSGEFGAAQGNFDNLERKDRIVTEQDKAIHGLCRPERLLDLTYRFTLFDKGVKKIARHQQFFVVRSIVARVKQRDDNGNRLGGIVWQTQGSGKSLTMVMLTRALALQTDITNPRILLVTDRDDLDKQLGNTFYACGLSKERAKSGKNLITHLKNKVGIITTLVHKFDKGWISKRFVDDSSDIFVLVDESHRTQYGEMASKMRQTLPNACYIGFTGTPLLKSEKSSFLKFGALIEPHYSFRRAVKDKSVLPLLYEGRLVEMKQNQEDVDLWFERHTAGLTDAQKADLKRKYARANTLNKAEQVVYTRAFDISEHYRANWQNTGFKAQLVAPDKATAIKYHKCLKEIGMVSSEVVISPPDTREGHTEVDGEPTDAVREFWARMMKRFNNSEDEYNRQIINNFKHGDEPEILIVVNKLLTGFDAPRNTVMYLCQTLREHTLLQAIARVNRPYKDKEFGYIIDYDRTLGELDKALTMYEAFEGFDEQDLTDALTSVSEEVEKLPQRHSHLWDIFRGVKNRYDEEEFEHLLAKENLRADFYECLTAYGRSLAVALSTDRFVMNTDPDKLRMYKDDLNRFQNLRKSVRRRYAESIDYDEYEPRIKKLLDTHIQASKVTRLNEPVDILGEHDFDAVKEEYGIYSSSSAAAKADRIAYRTKKVAIEKMEEDPAFYKRFSTLIQEAINAFMDGTIRDLEYLDRVTNLKDEMYSGSRDDVPDRIRDNPEARAHYGVIQSHFPESDRGKAVAAEAALAIQKIIGKHSKVDFWTDYDAQKVAQNDIDDFLYDQVNDKYGAELSTEQMDEIIEKTMRIARNQRGNL